MACIKVFEGSETFLRDFIFIEDVMEVVKYLFQSGESGIFNCGTGQARSFMDIIKLILSMHQVPLFMETGIMGLKKILRVNIR